jgi:hypothetical protein
VPKLAVDHLDHLRVNALVGDLDLASDDSGRAADLSVSGSLPSNIAGFRKAENSGTPACGPRCR